MRGLVSVPRIVHHLCPTVVVGAHGEEVFLRQVHHPLAFILIVGSAIGMGAVVEVGEVTVEVDVVAVVTFGVIHRVVASVIGAIGVGAGEDEEIDIVEDVLDAGISACAELIDEAQHEDHARHLVAVHGGGVEELGLAIRMAVVQAHAKNPAVVRGGQCTQIKEGAVGSIGH